MIRLEVGQIEQALEALHEDLLRAPPGDCPPLLENRLHQIFAVGRSSLHDLLPHGDGLDLIGLVDHLWSPVEVQVVRFVVGQAVASIRGEARFPWSQLEAARESLGCEEPPSCCDGEIRGHVEALVAAAQAALPGDPLLARLSSGGADQLTVLEAAALAGQALAAWRHVEADQQAPPAHPYEAAGW